MQNAYIIHGVCSEEEFFSPAYPCGSNFHWLPWLQKQLVMKGLNCQTPQMPVPYAPVYRDWQGVFESFPVDEDTTLIGHSAGCGFFLKWLSQNNVAIDKLVLIAPWLDPLKETGPFLDCTLDPALAGRVREMHVFYSADEPVEGVRETVDRILETYPAANLHEFNDKGHFCLKEMHTEEFPELLEVVLA